jgi:hypothetical protein
MSDDRKEGLGAAVRIILDKTGLTQPEAAAATAAMRAEQLALIPSEAAIADATGTDDQAQRSGPGRPPGSRNRRTEEWVDFISSRYRSPLLFLAETFTRPVAQLASELGTDRLEAFKIQVAAAKELAPYLHQKQPLAVAVKADGEVQLVIAAPAAAPIAAPGDGAVVINGEATEIEEKQ